jgi:hypothetical protein
LPFFFLFFFTLLGGFLHSVAVVRVLPTALLADDYLVPLDWLKCWGHHWHLIVSLALILLL